MATRAQRRIAVDFGLVNVRQISRAANEEHVPFHVACALFQKESGGHNVYGHDVGGALSGYPRAVNEENYAVFRWMVITKGMTSNGVGPSQITWRGFFPDMESQGLKPYDVLDNMRYGLRILRGHYDTEGNWRDAGTRYNGSSVYGADFAVKIGEWYERLYG